MFEKISFSDFKELDEKYPHILDSELSLRKKLGTLVYLCMKNNENTLVRVEKFLINTIHEDVLTTFEKFRTVDDFSGVRNGMMKMKTVEWIYHTSLEIMWILYKSNININDKIKCVYYLFRNDIPTYWRREIINDMRNINPETITTEQLANFVDLLEHSGVKDLEERGEALMVVLRQREEARNVIRNNEPKIKTVYKDSQNVHDSTINNSIKESISVLAKDCHKPEYKYEILTLSPIEVIEKIQGALTESKLYTENIENSLKRISTDFAVFTTEHKFRLRDLLQRVWNRIMNVMTEEYRKEATIRLANELNEASNTCSTGHMSRIMNILSGFPIEYGGLDNIRISWESQIISNIDARINFKIKTGDKDGDILTSMISDEYEERKVYLTFISDSKEGVYNELLKEFEPMFDKAGKGIDKKLFDTYFEKAYGKYK